MSESVKLTRKIPLDDCIINYDGLTIRSVADMGKIILQRSNNVTNREMEILGQNFAQTFETDLPMQTCRKAVGNDRALTVLCIGPTSLIILCGDQDIGKITEWFEESSNDVTITTSEMTDQYVCLDIEGEHAHSLLAKGCAIDLSEGIFTKDCVVRTLLAQANIILWRNGVDDYRILIDVSLGDYLWQWLEGAAIEFSKA